MEKAPLVVVMGIKLAKALLLYNKKYKKMRKRSENEWCGSWLIKTTIEHKPSREKEENFAKKTVRKSAQYNFEE